MSEEIIIDLGNGVTKIKNSSGKKFNFRSTTITKNIIQRSADTHIVKIDGIGSIIGAKDGKTFPGERRYGRIDYEHSLLTAICVGHDNKDEKNINATIKLNLPLQLYQEDYYVNKLISFENIKNKEVTCDGVTYNVSIDKVTPLPEGLLLNTLSEEEVKNKRNMFLDFGYGTLDIIISLGFEIEKVLTVKKGIIILYDVIAKKLNTTRENVEYYYNTPKEAIVDCKPMDITTIKHACLQDYADDVLNILENLNDGSLEGINKIYFLGGGSQVIYNDFKEFIRNNTVLVDDPTYSNVDIFENLN